MSEQVSLDLVRLLVRRNLGSFEKNVSGDEVVEKLSGLTHVRLDRERLPSVPLLDFLPRITNLYLQCNRIREMVNLSSLRELRFLTLAENQISEVRGIKDLPKLGFLDVTDNRIESLNFREIPKNLLILNISGNPCADTAAFLDDVTVNLPNLKSLDGDPVAAVSSTDEDESDSEEKMERTAGQDEAISKPPEGDDKNKDFFDDLKSDMVNSFKEFLSVMKENEKVLRRDFDEFTTLPEGVVPSESDVLSDGLSEKEICVLERDVFATTGKSGSSKLPRNLSPHPPSGTKYAGHAKTTPSSRGKTITRVRTPGARPFQRVVK